MFAKNPPPAGIFTICDDKSTQPKETKWQDFFLEVDNAHKASVKVYLKDKKNKKGDTFTINHSA